MSYSQDKIYLLKEQRIGKTIEISSEKIKYQNPYNPGPVYSVATSKVYLLFNDRGGFLSFNILDTSSEHVKKLIGGFVSYIKPSDSTFDKIITLQKKELFCNIIKEEEKSIYINVNDVEVKIDTTNIAAIIYKDGRHKVYGEIETVAKILSSLQDKYLITSPKSNESIINHKSTNGKTLENPIVVKPTTNIETPVKKVVNENKATAPVIKVPDLPKYTTISIISNKGSSLKVLLNDSLVGNIKPSTTKKIQIKEGDYILVLDDLQGHQLSNNISIDNKLLGKELTYPFPEIDYAAIKNAEAKRKQAVLDSIETNKKKSIELEKQKEKEIITYKNTVLLSYVDSLTNLSVSIIKLRDSLELNMLNIKKGIQEVNSDFENQYLQLKFLKAHYQNTKKTFIDSANKFRLNEISDKYLVQSKNNESRFEEKVGEFIQNISNGKAPISSNVYIALKNGRVSDFSFFITKDSINDYKIDNEILIYYALRNKLNVETFNYLIKNGAEVDYFGKRFYDNSSVFETPLAIACINGDVEIVKLFVAAKANFFPPNSTPKEKKKIFKYLLPKISNPAVYDILKSSNYDLNDGSEDLKKALDDIKKSMIYIKGGQFIMGCTEDQQADCVDAEKPAIEISINSFYLAKYEVTRKMWLAVMDDYDPSEFKDCLDCPIDGVSYDSVVIFIKKLNFLTGKKFRLPTEAEWEFAARGGNEKSKSFKYSGSDNSDEVAVTKENSSGKPSNVGTKKPNDLNLYDMSGNIAEWCSDWYSETYYIKSSKTNPLGPEKGFKKVVRGGAWGLSLWSSRVSRRLGLETNTSTNVVGFRLALNED